MDLDNLTIILAFDNAENSIKLRRISEIFVAEVLRQSRQKKFVSTFIHFGDELDGNQDW